MAGFRALPLVGGPEILDVDVHEIPARNDEPAHEHHDIRFLLDVSEKQPISAQEAESLDVRWFTSDEITAGFDEESVLRMGRKAADWLGRSPVGPASQDR